MGEIITLQLGRQSNYLATHFWNIQESYFTYDGDEDSAIDHYVHFRPGQSLDGTDTFLPRTVIYDLKGGFGSLRKYNALYDARNDDKYQPIWTGPTSTYKAPQIEMNPYQLSLESGVRGHTLTDSSVRYWSDFNRVYYHPRSIVQLMEFDIDSTIAPFTKWAMGEELFDSLDKEHDLLDRDLRPFVEEADRMQGIQIFSGLDDGWAGFASRYLDSLVDEYGKTAIWTWGSQNDTPGTSRETQNLRLVNLARSIANIPSQTTTLIPLSLSAIDTLPGIHVSRKSIWQTSAFQTIAVESALLPTRLKSGSPLTSICETLHGDGRQTISYLGVRIAGDVEWLPYTDSRGEKVTHHDTTEFGREIHVSSIESQGEYEGSNDLSEDIFGEVEIYRGSSKQEGDGQIQRDSMADRSTRTRVFRSELAFPVPDSFPPIIEKKQAVAVPNKLSVLARMSTSPAVGRAIKELRSEVYRFFPFEEREALVNSLGEIADAYQRAWDSGTDEGDDE